VLRIRVVGDWGGALPSDVEAVARSAASSFPPLEDGESIGILLEPVINPDDPPITINQLNVSGEVVVRLAVRGNHWAQMAFQFAHEFCHVLADIRTWPGYEDRFAWIEEAICATASHFALRSMAKTWAVSPPYPIWQEYAVNLDSYAVDRMAEPKHSLPPGLSFSDWMADHLSALESNPQTEVAGREVIAKELLPVFEADKNAWRAVRHLHVWQRASTATLDDFVQGWADASPPECRPAVDSIGLVISRRRGSPGRSSRRSG